MVMEMEMEMGRARGANERPENYFKLTVAIASVIFSTFNLETCFARVRRYTRRCNILANISTNIYYKE